MAIPQEYIAELSRRTDITELVGSYVQLKRAGRMERGLCPFHNEKTPSFYVYPDTNSFYCFGCGAGGDAITFVKTLQNLEYVEAVKFLAARAGMPLPEEDDSMARLRGQILAINRKTARYYATCLNAEGGRAARAYLRGRGLSDSTIRRFGLGYAPDTFGGLLAHLKGEGYQEEQLLQAGVVKRSQRGGLYDAFRGRIVFPIIDLRGNVIAFGGRQMADERGPKYLNSGETAVFKKSRGLFALNLAKKSGGRRYILCEGYMDVISLHQAGFTTAVATLGTALTAEQAKLISNYADEVVLCYDADDAGQRATTRAVKLFENTQLRVTVLTISGAKDPDEYIKKYGPERFEALLAGSRNIIEYELHKLKSGFDITKPDEKATYIRQALDVLAAGARPVERDIYAGRLAEETDVAKSSIVTQLETVVRTRQRRMAKEREKRILQEGTARGIDANYAAGGNSTVALAFAEQQLVAAIIKNPEDYLPLACQRLTHEQFISADMATAYKTLCRMGRAGEYIDMAMLSAYLPPGTIALLGKVLAQNYDIGFAPQDVEMFIARIEKSNLLQANPGSMSDTELEKYLEQLRREKQ